MTEQIFIQSARSLILCKLVDFYGNERIVEPYMIYDSATGLKIFHCFQNEGFSRSGERIGWKNIQTDSIKNIFCETKTFLQRPEYNPFNMKMFPVVHFSIPTFRGQKR